MSLLYYKNYRCFYKLMWRNKSFSPVFGSNQLRFSLYKLPASTKIFQNTLKNTVKQDISLQNGKMWVLVWFNFNQFKTLSSLISAFKFSVAKKSFYAASVSSSIKYRCSSSCVAVFYSILSRKQLVKNFLDQSLQRVLILVSLVAIQENDHLISLKARMHFSI